jgi:hypothetical protein
MSSQDFTETDYDETSVSERISEHDEDSCSRLDSDDELEVLELEDAEGGSDEDIFTTYAWSTAGLPPNQDGPANRRLAVERQRLRDSLRGSPFSTAFEWSRLGA